MNHAISELDRVVAVVDGGDAAGDAEDVAVVAQSLASSTK